MNSLKKITVILVAVLFSPLVVAATVGMVGSGKPTCGAVGQDLCGTGPAIFESNAIGVCPAGTFADIGKWGCYKCPAGFDRGIAAVDSDRACTRKKTGKKNEQLTKATLQGSACPKGSFFDPVRGGECWSCPSGYIRSAAHIDWKDACVILPRESLKKVTEKSKATGVFKTDCPGKQFWDGVDGNCHICPSGYKRTGHHVHSSKACSKFIEGRASVATLKGQAKCEDGEITDFLKNPEQGGNCYACKAGYDRTVFPVDGKEACETTPELEFKTANKTKDLTCPAGQIFDLISTYHPDVKKKLAADKVAGDQYTGSPHGTCWSCPPGGTRSWSSVTASDACILADVGWDMPTYNHVGLFGLNGATKVVLDIVSEESIVTLAEGFRDSKFLAMPKDEQATFIDDMWQEISDNPQESGLLALAAFAKLQEYAKTTGALKPHEREFLNHFEESVTAYKTAMATEALKIYEVWQKGAARRYFDPAYNRDPMVILWKAGWASIGVLAPPDPEPPDFATLVYELEEKPLIESIAVLGMTAADISIDHGVLSKLMPNDPVGDLGGKIRDKLADKLISTAEQKIIDQIARYSINQAMKEMDPVGWTSNLI